MTAQVEDFPGDAPMRRFEAHQVVVEAPSSLAVEVAENFNVTMAGFSRPYTMNVYSQPERVLS
jgi:hypothetical protein